MKKSRLLGSRGGGGGGGRAAVFTQASGGELGTGEHSAGRRYEGAEGGAGEGAV